MRPLRIPSNRILTDSSASSTQAYLVLRFQILLQVSPRHFTGVLQGIAAGIGISNLLRAILMVCLNSSSSGSMKKIPRFVWHYRASVSRWFTFASLFVFMHQTYASTYLAIHCRVLRSFVSSLVSHRTVYIHQVAFRSKRINLVKPVHASDYFVSPSTFQ